MYVCKTLFTDASLVNKIVGFHKGRQTIKKRVKEDIYKKTEKKGRRKVVVMVDLDGFIKINKYYLQHEQPCCIGRYKLEPKARVCMSDTTRTRKTHHLVN